MYIQANDTIMQDLKLQAITNTLLRGTESVGLNMSRIKQSDMLVLLLKYNELYMRANNKAGIYFNVDCLRHTSGGSDTYDYSSPEFAYGLVTLTPDSLLSQDVQLSMEECRVLEEVLAWAAIKPWAECCTEMHNRFYMRSKRNKHRVKPVDQLFHSVQKAADLPYHIERLQAAYRVHKLKTSNNTEENENGRK